MSPRARGEATGKEVVVQQDGAQMKAGRVARTETPRGGPFAAERYHSNTQQSMERHGDIDIRDSM